MDVKNKPGCRCCSPCEFTCTGDFPTIGGFVLGATTTASPSDFGSCDQCYWDLTLPLLETVDDLSDPTIDINGNCCTFRRQWTSECCATVHPDYVKITDSGWISLGLFEQRTITYRCYRSKTAEYVVVDAYAQMCDDPVDGNELRLTVNHKWVVNICRTQSTWTGTWRRFGDMSVVLASSSASAGCVPTFDTSDPDAVAALTSCNSGCNGEGNGSWDTFCECDTALSSIGYFVERSYSGEFPTTACCDLIDTFTLTDFAINDTIPAAFTATEGNETTAFKLEIKNEFGDVVATIYEPCVPSNVTLEVYGDGCGGTGTCVYQWDGSSWSLLTDGCTSLGCDCPELPTAPGDAPGDQISFPCVNCP